MSHFPEDFIIGTSCASYQIEGAWNEDGKGENIWDRLIHTKPDLVKNRDNADVACDFYHLYKEDVQLIKQMGLKMLRFSVSWARILPDGDITRINQAGIDFYSSLIEELLRNGIEPMVTIYHWDLPQRLQDMGGWLNPLIADYIEDYADVIFKSFGHKVKWWNTINEPKIMLRGYEQVEFAPCLNLDSPANYIVGHNILKAHARIYRLYESKYRAVQNGKISIALDALGFIPKTDSIEDQEATERAWAFNVGWFAHPIYSKEGDYPRVMRELIDENSKKEGRRRSRLPTFTREEIDNIRGSFDFIAINKYTSRLVSAETCTKNKFTFLNDQNLTLSIDPSWPKSGSIWLRVYPKGMREVLLYVKRNYGDVPIFITECGYCSADTVDDTDRVNYYQEYLKEVAIAMEDYQCNVIGFLAWSFFDNFEWFHGYSHFGLVQVDFHDPKRKRTPKSSAKFFQEFARTRTIK